MNRIKQFIERWWRPTLLIFVLIILALTARWWLPLLLEISPQVRAWMKTNAEELQGWTSAVQGLLWLVATLILIYNFAHSKPKEPSTDTKQIIIADRATVEELLGQRAAREHLDSDTRNYLAALVDVHSRLRMTGMGVNNLPVEMELLELYVPLKARIEMPEGETWARQTKLAGRLMSEHEIESVGQRLSEPLLLAQLLRDHAGLIILGDPGAGKSTFMKMVALRAALDQSAELGIGARIPFLLPLSAYAIALAQKEAQQDTSLSQCIADYWRDINPNLPVTSLLDSALSKGNALLLLDGLDEVRDPALRKRVIDLTTHFFVHHKQKGNKFILTSRIVGYKEVRPATVGLQECTIVDFEQEEIERFAEQWTRAVARLAHKTSAVSQWDAERERKSLLDAVERNPGVRQLAANPLLLTILALMKRSGIELPERRADLYETYVKTLLKSWNLARSLGRPLTSDLDESETLKLLSPLALWMHEVSPGIGLVEEEAVKRKLIEICTQRGISDPEAASLRLLRDVHDHSALLLERGHRQYGFIHTTFQEYLAARAVALQGQRDSTVVVKALAAHIDDPNWHEVSLLTIGYIGLVQQNDEVASAVIDGLLQQAPGEPGAAAVLAGECVADVGQTGVTLPAANW